MGQSFLFLTFVIFLTSCYVDDDKLKDVLFPAAIGMNASTESEYYFSLDEQVGSKLEAEDLSSPITDTYRSSSRVSLSGLPEGLKRLIDDVPYELTASYKKSESAGYEKYDTAPLYFVDEVLEPTSIPSSGNEFFLVNFRLEKTGIEWTTRKTYVNYGKLHCGQLIISASKGQVSDYLGHSVEELKTTNSNISYIGDKLIINLSQIGYWDLKNIYDSISSRIGNYGIMIDERYYSEHFGRTFTNGIITSDVLESNEYLYSYAYIQRNSGAGYMQIQSLCGLKVK